MPNRKPQAQYAVTIPQRKDILRLLKKSRAPKQLDEIAQALKVVTSAERAALNKRLKAMLRDGQIVRNRREGYSLLNKMDLIAGRIMAHPDGYGFIRPDEGGDDLYLSLREMRKVLHGDHVIVRQGGIDRHGRREALIVETIEAANNTVVGKYYREQSIGFLVPDNRRIHQDILIPSDKTLGARQGDVVVAEITRQPDKHTQPIGGVIEVLGNTSSIDMAVDIALRAYDIPHRWPDEVLAEADGLSTTIKANKQRRDLRTLPFVTIDGAKAEDFDDAVYCRRDGGSWRLLVAIADVSHYVKAGTALDQEAALRGNSVYFPNRVIPMLPEKLANELCSLKPAANRYAMVCELAVSDCGRVEGHEFYPAIIRSVARLTYDEVDKVIQGRDKAHGMAKEIGLLHTLYQAMHARRADLGLLDFATTETVMQFDAEGQIVDIHALSRNDAHRLIEEFMLAANVATAESLLQAKLPVLFRNHDRPAEEKITQLNAFLGGLGLQLAGGMAPKTRDYARIMALVQSRDDKRLIETVLLRSLPLAVYEAKNKGHFGLAFAAYTHFTSPIRRYPDLLAHRAIRRLLKQKQPGHYTATEIHQLGAHAGMTERRADEATRDVSQRMKCEFMLDKVGNRYHGTVSGVTGFGLFVELDDVCVEGLIHVTRLPRDYYHFDPITHSLTGEANGRRYYLGDRIRVEVIQVNADERKIDLECLPRR